MPDPSVYGKSWYASQVADVPARGRLSIELDVDVCVIGGGLAGLTVALEVARRGWSVAVLEARRIAWNASGRNAGFVVPGFPADPNALIEKVGPAHAKALWALSESGADYVRRTIRDTGMAGAEIEEAGWLRVSKTADETRLADYAAMLVRELNANAEFWPGERVRTKLRSKRYFGGIHFPGAFCINPLNYALGLAAAAEAAGARIFEETPALDIDPAGVRKRITTPSARVRAGHVVLAGNVHIGGLLPELSDTLVPISSYSIVTAPLGDKLREAVTFRGAVSDSERADNHYRIVDRDRLLWSGRLTVWERDPKRYARALAADIARTYPQLGKVETEFAWGGTLGATVHRMPQVGELFPGVWLLSGFGAQGIANTAMGADVVARAILDGGQAWRLFLPFDLVWAGCGLGRTAVQGAYWYGRGRDGIRSALARRRHPVDLPEIPEEPAIAPEQPAEPPVKRRSRRKTAKAAEPDSDTPAAAN